LPGAAVGGYLTADLSLVIPDAPLSDVSAVLTDGRIPSTLKARLRRLKTTIVRPHVYIWQFYFLYFALACIRLS
jgi:hypothetical protein